MNTPMNILLLSRVVWGLFTMAALGCEGPSSAEAPPMSTPETTQVAQGGPIIKDVGVAEFQALMAQLDGALLLDVRTTEEWAEGHLAGAAHKDYWGDADFDEAMNGIPRNRPVLVYCAGGGRSGLTAKELHNAGHLEVYNLESGIAGWIKAGQPVVTGPPADF
ncbi:MAG: rhodanese-like domain-containing protein [Bacteroidetes bacterium]|nr:rhodanese-like domain-containing protein [Bacteroidota bacterium]MDA0902946.1 rhodanese-like domain-containing protein [Bacteroidota bacterium]MDA1241638.1 rhodanese-like domain-containing protein [Bacteroidota bacterium]